MQLRNMAKIIVKYQSNWVTDQENQLLQKFRKSCSCCKLTQTVNGNLSKTMYLIIDLPENMKLLEKDILTYERNHSAFKSKVNQH